MEMPSEKIFKRSKVAPVLKDQLSHWTFSPQLNSGLSVSILSSVKEHKTIIKICITIISLSLFFSMLTVSIYHTASVYQQLLN